MMLALLVYCTRTDLRLASDRAGTYRDIGVPWRRTVIRTTTRSARSGASNFEAVSGGVPAAVAKELKAACSTVSCGTWTRTRTSATASATTVRGRSRSCEARSRGCWIRRSRTLDDVPDPQGLPEELSRRDKLRAKLDRRARVGTACAGACGLGAGGVRAQGGGAGAAYGIAQGSARHQATDGSAGGTRADQPDGRGQCADAGAGTMVPSGVQRAGGSGCRRQSVGVGVAGERVRERPQRVGGGRGGDTAALGAADRVLADSGYATGSEVSQLAGRLATGAEGQRRRHDFRPEPPEQLAKEPQADWIKSMPAFAPADGGAGVRDREAGALRGLEKVEGEWALVTLAYNCRRVHNLRLATGLYGAELGVFATHQRRRRPPGAVSDGQDTVPVSVERPSRHRDTGRRSNRCQVASTRCRA